MANLIGTFFQMQVEPFGNFIVAADRVRSWRLTDEAMKLLVALRLEYRS